MKHQRAHSHPCRYAELGCNRRVPCDGVEVENYDGAPGVICTAYHLEGGRLAEIACTACTDARCSECGSVTRLESHAMGCTYWRAREAGTLQARA